MKNKTIHPYEHIKLSRGEWLGLYPYGYRVIKIETRTKWNSAGTVIVDEDKKEIIKDLFNTFKKGGYGLNSIHAYIKNKYACSLCRSSICRILHNKFYTGIMTWKGREYSHSYEKFIPVDDFEICQVIMQKNTKHCLYIPPVRAVENKPTDNTLSHMDDLVFNECNCTTIDELIQKTSLSFEELLLAIYNLKAKNLIEENIFGEWNKKNQNFKPIQKR